MAPMLDAFLADLEAAKNNFGRGAAASTAKLLRGTSRARFGDSKSLIRLHEVLLFLRAFPQSPLVVSLTETLLDSFHERVRKIRALGADMSDFDDFDTSGIAGTAMQDTLSFEAARWLVRRIPRYVGVAWSDYDEERAMGATWLRFIPLLAEDSDVEANIPWRHWIDAARGGERDLPWLIRRFERLNLGKNEAERARSRIELYDSLRIPIRWDLGNLKLSRTRNWSRSRRTFFHTEPLISRKDVSLAREFARPAPQLRRLSFVKGESVMRLIREVMVVRYRELYGTTLGDARSVVRADVGRGVVIYLWNLPPDRRLPLRAYVAGFTVKNGVPINYIEAIGLCDWIEVGFNTFYTYRQGETAWIYAQALRCLQAMTKATTFSIYPYQIGQNNDEALDSGAFWFYRKLGFRSGSPELEELARSEERKIAADPRHRTSRKILKRLAEAHLFYEMKQKSAEAKEVIVGPWDSFSTRNLGLRVSRRMAQGFGGDAIRIRAASVAAVTRALDLDARHWSEMEIRSLENWSLVLGLIPRLGLWPSKEKQALEKIIRSQSGRNEMSYLRRTQRHPRLRLDLLRLGST